MKETIIYILLLLSLGIPCLAKVILADIWSAGVGVQAMSMGQTYTALANNYSGAHWNPAGLANQKNKSIGSEFSKFFGEIQRSSFDLVWPDCYGGTIAVGFTSESISDIPHTDANANDHASIIDYYSDKKTALGIAFGKTINSNLDCGLTIKQLAHQHGQNQASTLSFDLGFLYKTNSQVYFALVAHNLNSPSLCWDNGTIEKQEQSIILSSVQYFFNCFVTLIEDVNLTEQQSSIGCSLALHKALDLRAGIKDSRLYAGVGIHLSGITLDYAYTDHADLGASNMLGLSFW